MPKVSVIVVNYNGKKLIRACLGSLINQSFKACEVIVVDNNSSDGSLREIRSFLQENTFNSLIKLVPLGKNAGFAGGNIEGLKHANGDYVALLNPDAIADRFWIEELVKAMESHPEVGICASKMIVHGTNIIDSAGDGYATSLKGFKRGEGENEESFNQHEYVFGACAGAALYRKEMIKEIGFFDKDFFLIHEDTDFNYRAQLAGWKVLYVPSAIVYHRVGSSIGNMSDVVIYYSVRNSEFVRMKNVAIGFFCRCIIEFIIGLGAEFIYYGIKPKKIKIYFKAKIDALRFMPEMLTKRREIIKGSKLPNKYIFGMMTSMWDKDFRKEKVKNFIQSFNKRNGQGVSG